ncbi:MAG: helix-turn-helix transcriptional regulator [Pseudomonadota bacterium]
MGEEHTQIETGDITKPRLSAGQFEKIRLQLGLSDEELADALGLSANGPVAIGKMRRGQKEVSGPVTTAMLAFVDGFRPPWWPL